MKKIFFWIMLTCSIMSFAQGGENQTIKLLRNSNFYFLDQLSNESDIVRLLNENITLRQVKESKSNDIQLSISNDTIIDTTGLVNSYLFTEKEIERIAKEIVEMSAKHKILSHFFDKIRASGKYANFNSLSNNEFISSIVKLNLEGLNHTLKVYGLGQAPMYYKIDAASYNKDSNYFKYAVDSWGRYLYSINDYDQKNLFAPSLDYALYLMYMNHRDEAIRYEPLSEKYNNLAVEYVKEVNFDNYQYNALIVLGDGPDNYRDNLGALGKLNLRKAVEEYNKGKAPFIIVSGGHVHPNRTKTCEAIEMKKELIRVYQIPEKAIIVEPYARHTTTNLRNATRLMLDYGFNIKQKSMIVSNPRHIKSIESKLFDVRFMDELGYLPGKIDKQSNGVLLDFYPSAVMTHINPLEPLDP